MSATPTRARGGAGRVAAAALLALALAAPPARPAGGADPQGPAAADAFRWPIPAWMPPPPAPAEVAMTPALVELGRHLFYDARLSADGTVACASCHVQALAFTDGRSVALGVHGTPGRRNAPSLADAGHMPTLTWANPHVTTLEVQALAPLFGTELVEMGLARREAALLARLAADPFYAAAFPAAFPDRPVPDPCAITRALGAFLRTLISLGSRDDRATRGGEPGAMSEAARRGQALFFDHRLECYHCHAGALFTDNLQTGRTAFPESACHNTGLYNLGGTGAYPPGGLGLCEVTGVAADIGRFRTPSLRHVAVTAPYMHAGSIATREQVIRHQAAGGCRIADGPHAGAGRDHPFKDGLIAGFAITGAEIADLVACLESLTDEGFLADPAYADPWPDGHSARARRMSPVDRPRQRPPPQDRPAAKPPARPACGAPAFRPDRFRPGSPPCRSAP